MSALLRSRRLLGSAALPLLALTVLVSFLAASAPPSPDDWDGLGFLSSVVEFDMRRFSPHPPGYPVYVAALQVAHLMARDPLAAAYVVSIASAAACAALTFATALRVCRSGEAVVVASSAIATPLAWRAASAVGSEGLALAFVALGLWSTVAARRGTRSAAYVLGAAVGLGVGVRLSWAPLFVPMLVLAPRDKRGPALLAAAGATAMWAIPLLAVVGPSELVRLYTVHGEGHASRWGGTAITDPGAARVLYLARDVFVDGLGIDADALGILIGAGVLALAVGGIGRWHRARWRGGRAVALLLVPYACWIAIGQNLRQQPRHALPLVVAMAVGLAVVATRAARWRAVGVVVAALIVSRTAMDATARRTILPPGAQLSAFANGLPDARGTAVFAGPSARFFQATPLADRAVSTPSLDDARLALTRLDDYPRRILVTSELEGTREAHLPVVATFCRPPRLDRRAPCLVVYEWSLTPSAPALR